MYVCMYVRSYVDMRYEPVYNTDLMTWTTIIPCLIFFGVDEDIFHVLNNLKCNLTEIDPRSLVRCSWSILHILAGFNKFYVFVTE